MSAASKYNFVWVDMSAHQTPVFEEVRGKDYILYGASKSKEWRKKSKHFRKLVDYTCAICGKKKKPADMHCHHNTYDHLGHEMEHPECITVLCWGCHKLYESNKRGYCFLCGYMG